MPQFFIFHTLLSWRKYTILFWRDELRSYFLNWQKMTTWKWIKREISWILVLEDELKTAKSEIYLTFGRYTYTVDADFLPLCLWMPSELVARCYIFIWRGQCHEVWMKFSYNLAKNPVLAWTEAPMANYITEFTQFISTLTWFMLASLSHSLITLNGKWAQIIN